MKSKKRPALACPIDAIGASACPMVAFSGFCESHEPPPSGDVRGIVPAHCDDRLKLSERVLAQWWRLVAFMKATNLLRRAMHAV